MTVTCIIKLIITNLALARSINYNSWIVSYDSKECYKLKSNLQSCKTLIVQATGLTSLLEKIVEIWLKSSQNSQQKIMSFGFTFFFKQKATFSYKEAVSKHGLLQGF
jgi:hypothetical protein